MIIRYGNRGTFQAWNRRHGSGAEALRIPCRGIGVGEAQQRVGAQGQGAKGTEVAATEVRCGRHRGDRGGAKRQGKVAAGTEVGMKTGVAEARSLLSGGSDRRSGVAVKVQQSGNVKERGDQHSHSGSVKERGDQNSRSGNVKERGDQVAPLHPQATALGECEGKRRS
eukprot:scaffold301550_cov14-Tisochrysis_lutea.AAC.2